jgi:hypothetical protein
MQQSDLISYRILSYRYRSERIESKETCTLQPKENLRAEPARPGVATVSVAPGNTATAVTGPVSCGGAGDQLKRPCRPLTWLRGLQVIAPAPARAPAPAPVPAPSLRPTPAPSAARRGVAVCGVAVCGVAVHARAAADELLRRRSGGSLPDHRRGARCPAWGGG